MPVRCVLAGSGECRTKFIELVIFCFCLIKTFQIISCFPVELQAERISEEYKKKRGTITYLLCTFLNSFEVMSEINV